MNAKILMGEPRDRTTPSFQRTAIRNKSGPLKADRPYREIVTAMVVETLQLFCGLSDKDTWLTFHKASSQNKLVGDPN